ncbi:sidekick-like protein [Dinothrombium tinctorium]|uniref:Sidekick-like protein n=1 Tax=Dinothrombium tinctorium TaxID=1965070 RepID=A0A3S4R4N1_9ACAR|nr:sidekick-like protein [Dinothrombium tinctorium]RWS11551.1 sidekick-like protein [Dinothrombium tinctorium]
MVLTVALVLIALSVPEIWTISAPVIITPHSENITAVDGTDNFIPCRAIGDPKPDIRWFKRRHMNDTDEPIADSSESRRYLIKDEGLLIAPVDGTKDEGIYTCVRSNHLGSANATAFLDIIVRTQILHPPQDTKVILSSTANLRCAVRYDHSIPISIQWFFNEKPINTEASSRVHVLPDGTLSIEQARNTDVGVYTCRVSSSAGNDSKSARLFVLELPHPSTSVKAELNFDAGFVNVSWTPPFDGNSPIIKYIVQKRIVENEDESLTDLSQDNDHGWSVAVANISAPQTFVLINNLRPATTYQFRVKAVNLVGEGQPSLPSVPPITLPAQPPSAPPSNVVGAARSSTAITIQWQAPTSAHNGHLLGYIVRYKLAGYSETPWFGKNITNPAQLSFILDDLIVWQNYEIQVGAYNEMGIGSYSPSIYVRTKEGKPASAPTKVSAEAINSTAIRINWHSPDPQLINGINQGYKVRAFSNGVMAKELVVSPHPLPDKMETAYLTDLEPFTEYSISITCFTSAGDGPSNDPPIRVTTKQDLPGEVTDFRFWNILDSSVEIGWGRPIKINGLLLGYTLQYYVNASSVDQWKLLNFSESVRETKIIDLKPQTAYTFEIYAWTEIGKGPVKSSTIKTSIPPVLPQPPTRLAISNIGAFSVVIQFTPGFNGNATINKWIVEALVPQSKNANWTAIYETENQTQTDAIFVKNLKPYTDYRLRLIPFNVVGRSILPSEPSRPFQTLQAAPSQPPLNVTLRSLTPESIKVKWTPLPRESWYGNPRGYNITWHESHDTAFNRSLKWHFHTDLNFPSYTITGLEKITNYSIQIFAVNDVGSSSGSRIVSEKTAETASVDVDEEPTIVENESLSKVLIKRAKLPFYFQSWFVTGLACLMIILIILFTAGLCVYNTTYKYKQELKKSRSQNGLSEEEFGFEDGMENPYASGLELRNNAVSSNYRRNNGALNTGLAMAATKSPPRPAPGSLTYSDDEEDTKDINLYGSNSDSVTEKPSELSSSGPDSESDREDDMAAVNHFVNHYANVNDTLRKGQPSWKKHAHPYVVKPPEANGISSRSTPSATGPPPPSYNMAVAVTAADESELDCLSVNLNGGRIIVNNAVGSRAGVIPGFSSFV